MCVYDIMQYEVLCNQLLLQYLRQPSPSRKELGGQKQKLRGQRFIINTIGVGVYQPKVNAPVLPCVRQRSPSHKIGEKPQTVFVYTYIPLIHALNTLAHVVYRDSHGDIIKDIIIICYLLL